MTELPGTLHVLHARSVVRPSEVRSFTFAFPFPFPFALPLSAAMLAMMLLVSACGSTQGPDYKTAGASLKPLDVPPDLVSPDSDTRFSVPEPGASTTLSEYERARSQGGTVNTTLAPKNSAASLQREGQMRWLKLAIPPEQVWPQLRDFWQQNGFVVLKELPEIGVMQTDWAEKRAKVPSGAIRNLLAKTFGTNYAAAERDSFKSRIEVVDDGTEIYVSHRGMSEVVTESLNEQTRWRPGPTDQGLEVEFLSRLMAHFGADETKALAEVTKVIQPEAAVAEIKVVDGANVLLFDETFDRAWRRVGLALDRSGFTVEDRDRSQGTYFVRYIDVDTLTEKPGLFARWFGGSKKEDPRQYRIVVAEQASKASVTVRERLPKDPPVAGTEVAKRMLTLIQEKLGR